MIEAHPSPWQLALQREGRDPLTDYTVASDEGRLTTIPDEAGRFLREHMPQISDTFETAAITARDNLEKAPDNLTMAGLSALTVLRATGNETFLQPWEQWYLGQGGDLKTTAQEDIAASYLANSIVPLSLIRKMAEFDPRFTKWENEILSAGREMVLTPGRLMVADGMGSFIDGYVFNHTSDPERIAYLFLSQAGFLAPEVSLSSSAWKPLHTLYEIRRSIVNDVADFHHRVGIRSVNTQAAFDQILNAGEAQLRQRLAMLSLPAIAIGMSAGISLSEMQRSGVVKGLTAGAVNAALMTGSFKAIEAFSRKVLDPFTSAYGKLDASIKQESNQIQPFQASEGEIAINEVTKGNNKKLGRIVWFKNAVTGTFTRILPKSAGWGSAALIQQEGLAAFVLGYQRAMSSAMQVMGNYVNFKSQQESAAITAQMLEQELDALLQAERKPLLEHMTVVPEPCIPEKPGSVLLDRLILPPVKPGESMVTYENLGITMPSCSFLTISGANGIGKTSLLRTFPGTYTAGNEDVRVGVTIRGQGSDLRQIPVRTRRNLFPLIQTPQEQTSIRSEIGILLASYPTAIEATPEEMKDWSYGRTDILSAQLVEHFHRLGFSEVQLSWFQRGVRLSSGQRSLLTIGTSLLIQDPDVTLLWDEPFSTLSDGNIDRLAHILFQLNKYFNGKIILTANQFPDEITSAGFSVGELNLETGHFDRNRYRGFVSRDEIRTARRHLEVIKGILTSKFQSEKKLKLQGYDLHMLEQMISMSRNKEEAAGIVWEVIGVKSNELRTDLKTRRTRGYDEAYDPTFDQPHVVMRLITSMLENLPLEKQREALQAFATSVDLASSIRGYIVDLVEKNDISKYHNVISIERIRTYLAPVIRFLKVCKHYTENHPTKQSSIWGLEQLEEFIARTETLHSNATSLVNKYDD